MRSIVGLLSLVVATSSLAASIEIPMFEVAQTGNGKPIGKITAVETPHGVLFKPQLKGLKTSPNVRGFHVHAGDSCDNFAQAALGHLDPENTNKHLGPYDKQGHLGDIQVLLINSNGSVTMPVFAPKLTIENIKGHTLVIHAGSDNYSDKPKPLGGGGDRVACGVIASAVKTTAAPASKPAAVKPAVPTATPKTTPAPAKAPVPATKSATSDAKNLSTDAQIQQLMERKKKLQALQQQSRQQLQTLQKQQPAP